MSYDEVDKILVPWLEARGYNLQTRDRGEEVRAFLVWSHDHKMKAQVGIMNVERNEVEVGVFDGRRRRERFSSTLEELADTLDKVEKLVRRWNDG